MKLVILVDNYAINGRNLKGEGGASYYIEDNNKKFLLDVGASDLFMKNAGNLNIDLDEINDVVLSHGHYDHTTGIKPFIESKNSKINILCHPLAFNKKSKNGENKGCPYTKDQIIKKANVKFSDKPVKVSDNIIYLGEIPNLVDFESRKLMGDIKDDNGNITEDYIMDDTALVYKSEKGIYIITGCSHSGICNIIEYAKKVTGENRVLGLIGGTHLQEINSQLYRTIDYLKDNNLKDLYPCHCTKFYVRAEMYKTLDIKDAYVGLEINW